MNIGDMIPEVLGIDAEGREWKASDFAGRKLIIYFYPKDNTPGCTAQACSLAEGYGRLQAAGYALLGVSRDSAASHTRFAQKSSPMWTARCWRHSACGERKRTTER